MKIKKCQPELEGQLMFEEDVLEEMKNIRDRMQEYEAEKTKLLNICKTCEEYEVRIREVIERLGI